MSVDHIIATVYVVLAIIGALLWLTGWVDDDENVDEDGWDRTPGQEPREVGLP